MMDVKESVVGKLLLRGKLELITPLLIGSGDRTGYVDTATIKDPDGMPYIPATSLAGVLRHFFSENVGIPEAHPDHRLFWGYSLPKGDSMQSALFIRDLVPQEPPRVIVRDGVRISPLGVAVDTFKYDYEVIEPGAKFDLYLEVTLRKQFNKDEFKRVFLFIVQALRSGEISLGAMSTKGLGSVVLADGYECREFDFSQRADVISWLTADFSKGKSIELPREWVYPRNNNDCVAVIDLAIANSLIIRDITADGDADAVHLTSNGKPVITGTSLKGALKSRAKRIVSTLGAEITVLDSLFGPDLPIERDVAKESKTELKLRRSRFLVNEPEIRGAIPQTQTRVKIDRFTGGVIDNLLFKTEPLWSKDDECKVTTIKLVIKDYKDWEIGLLLMLIKDLWTGDLPIGGEKSIGRGTFVGLRAELTYADKQVEIKNYNGNLVISGASETELQQYVDALLTECARGGVTCI